jgi:hypothetical protein
MFSEQILNPNRIRLLMDNCFPFSSSLTEIAFAEASARSIGFSFASKALMTNSLDFDFLNGLPGMIGRRMMNGPAQGAWIPRGQIDRVGGKSLLVRDLLLVQARSLNLRLDMVQCRLQG